MPDRAQILDQLYELIRPFAKEPMEFREQTNLIEEVGLDSMKIMDMVMQIEDHFDVSIPLNVLTDVRTIGDMAGQLQGLIKSD